MDTTETLDVPIGTNPTRDLDAQVVAAQQSIGQQIEPRYAPWHKPPEHIVDNIAYAGPSSRFTGLQCPLAGQYPHTRNIVYLGSGM